MNLVTNTGKQFDCGFFAVSDKLAVIRLKISLADAVQVFSDRNETKMLICDDRTIEGYTNIDALVPESEGIKVCLTKE